ncbi:hypothetical protein QJ857_gp0399 [Tupanvirus soda lake]|uniref:Uncharacterized protein n=2 Tax=Tupanvirus TaxID=2094720 RepID=A0A6N1NMR5_9VIRU|nr:hypothetical protein QJ857_gp0399 [Tupanvirus soda lake]QKU35635.1 hypothetical protein [Tupanvirus soda lake]
MYGFKPRGLWYAPGKAWLDWWRVNFDHDDDDICKYKYFYVIVPIYTTLDKPNVNCVLKIENVVQFDNFNFKYGFCKIKDNDDCMIKIQWDEVARDFGGIEIIPWLEIRSNFPFVLRKYFP